MATKATTKEGTLQDLPKPKKELTGDQAEGVKGGDAKAQPKPWSGPGDEGPEEQITFVYGKLG
jgi:hypothetical protein